MPPAVPMNCLNMPFPLSHAKNYQLRVVDFHRLAVHNQLLLRAHVQEPAIDDCNIFANTRFAVLHFESYARMCDVFEQLIIIHET